MERKFSLVYLTSAASAPPEMIYQAARAGFDFVSLRTIAMGLPNELNFGLTINKTLLQDTKRAVQETGVKVLDIENARIHDGVDLKKYLPEMEVAAEMGARAVLTNIWSADRAFNIETFAELCGHAKTFGLRVNLEFVTWAKITNISEALDLINMAGCENAGIVVDTLHFNRSRCTLEELAAEPQTRLTALHLCDASAELPDTVEGLIHTGRDERMYLGEGGIDIAGIVRNMPSDVVCGIEIPHIARTKVTGTAEHVHRSIESAKAYLAAHQL